MGDTEAASVRKESREWGQGECNFYWDTGICAGHATGVTVLTLRQLELTRLVAGSLESCLQRCLIVAGSHLAVHGRA